MCQNVYQGDLHGIVNLLFEEHVEFSDLVNSDFNVDTLSYYYKK